MYLQANIKVRPEPADFTTGTLRHDDEVFTLTTVREDGAVTAIELKRNDATDREDIVNALIAMLNNNRFISFSLDTQSDTLPYGVDFSNDDELLNANSETDGGG